MSDSGNFRGIVEIRDEMGSSLKVNVACCSTSGKEGTMQSLKEVVDGFSFSKIHNWTINGFHDSEGKIRKPCSRVWRTFTVLVNCDVALCCLDYDGKHVLGHVDDKTGIHEIWNGEAYRRVWALHRKARQGELSLCSNCSKSFFYLTRPANAPVADEPAEVRRKRAA